MIADYHSKYLATDLVPKLPHGHSTVFGQSRDYRSINRVEVPSDIATSIHSWPYRDYANTAFRLCLRAIVGVELDISNRAAETDAQRRNQRCRRDA